MAVGDGYTISTDKDRLDLDAVHTFLSERAYWALGRPRDVLEKAVAHSLCFGVYALDPDTGAAAEQVGFARVVTDYATFGWLCDVFVLEPHRGRGLGKRLIDTVVAHPELAELKIFLLATSDAHQLYRRYGGFKGIEQPERWMLRVQ
jgi:GNAT superfamily N-acetyltransferase